MTRSAERAKVRELRLKGYSIVAITKQVGISRPTVSRWCRDITLTPGQIRKLERVRTAVRYGVILEIAQRKREKRQKEILALRRDGEDMLGGKMSKRELMVLGAALYWGEGVKSGKTGLINSDPRVLKIFLIWLSSTWGIPKSRLIFTIRLNSQHRYRAEIVKSYWLDMLGVSEDQFTRTIFINAVHKKKYESDDTYFGTVNIYVTRGGDQLHKIMGLITGIAKKLGV